MLTRETFIGPWAGLPVAWTDDDRFDEETYRADIVSCCKAGVPGIYTGGTTGEFYAMEFDEFQTITKATVEECRHHNMPTMIGVSSTYTLGAVRRAAFAAETGADAVQVALPFWMEIDEREIVPFFKEVAAAADGLAVSVYETTRARRALTIDQHRAITDAVPNYLMVKANAGTIGSTPEGCAALSEIVNVFVGESLWASLGPCGAIGCCSSVVYWNPRVTLSLFELVKAKDWAAVDQVQQKLGPLMDRLGEVFEPLGFTDTAYDRMGGVASRFLKTSLRSRGPYRSATPDDVETLRGLYRECFPEMLEL